MKNQSRKIIVIISGLILFSFGQSASANDFSDVMVTQPNYDAINYVHTQNIVSGYPDNTFLPNNLITRAEFTKIVIETYYPGQASGRNCFLDVKSEWFSNYVCFAKENFFIGGYPDGTFKPDNNINFVDIAKILVNTKGLTVVSDSALWYKPYVEKLSELNAIPSSIKSFNQRVTRGEMAEIIYRLQSNITNKDFTSYKQLVEEKATPGLPLRLKIPQINVDALIEHVGLTADGAVGIPSIPANTAWYDLGPRPGESGNAVITGHLNWYYGAAGVFENLNILKIGDKIEVQDDKGNVFNFIVREIHDYDAKANASEVFYSRDGKAHLNLITCDGVWDKSAQAYSQRLVIFADKE